MRLMSKLAVWLAVGLAGVLYNYLFNHVGEHHPGMLGMFVFFTVAPVMAFAATRRRGGTI